MQIEFTYPFSAFVFYLYCSAEEEDCQEERSRMECWGSAI